MLIRRRLFVTDGFVLCVEGIDAKRTQLAGLRLSRENGDKKRRLFIVF